MNEVGVAAPPKRACQAPSCSNPIPRWRNGRKVWSATQVLQSEVQGAGEPACVPRNGLERGG